MPPGLPRHDGARACRPPRFGPIRARKGGHHPPSFPRVAHGGRAGILCVPARAAAHGRDHGWTWLTRVWGFSTEALRVWPSRGPSAGASRGGVVGASGLTGPGAPGARASGGVGGGAWGRPGRRREGLPRGCLPRGVRASGGHAPDLRRSPNAGGGTAPRGRPPMGGTALDPGSRRPSGPGAQGPRPSPPSRSGDSPRAPRPVPCPRVQASILEASGRGRGRAGGPWG